MSFFSKITVLLAILIVNPVVSHAQERAEYTLNPGDEIQISVWREETLDKQVIVLPDGHITFPLVGSVNVLGLSSVELENLIETKISDYIPEAEVTVIVNSVRGNTVFVIGKITNPGEFIMSSRMTVAQVLSLAGGIDRFADTGDIKVLRNENGTAKYFKYDYDGLLSGKVSPSINFILQAGDVVIVP